MRALNIIESAYRATLEEQGDTIVWFTRTIKSGGGDVDILLRGNAVNYGVKAQDAQGLTFGAWKQTRLPRLAEDIAGAMEKRIAVFLVSEDLADWGLTPADLIGGIEFAARGEIARLSAVMIRSGIGKQYHGIPGAKTLLDEAAEAPDRNGSLATFGLGG